MNIPCVQFRNKEHRFIKNWTYIPESGSQFSYKGYVDKNEIPSDAYYVNICYYQSVQNPAVKSAYIRFESDADIDTYVSTKVDEKIDESLDVVIDDKIDERINLFPDLLYNKVWACCGDSFSEGDFSSRTDTNYKFSDGPYKGLNKVYSRFIALRNNMQLHLLAKCGATVGLWKDDADKVNAGTMNWQTDTPTASTNLWYYYQLPRIPQNVDYITFWFGINDAGRSYLGTITDTTPVSYYGAYNYAIKTCLERWPAAHIGIIISNQCSSSTKNGAKEIAISWGIPYLDMSGDPQIPLIGTDPTNREIAINSQHAALRWNSTFRVSSTNGHPNEIAHEFQSTFIEAFLRRI